MKVLFVEPNFEARAPYHHGIASLSAKLKEAGHKTSFCLVYGEEYLDVKKAIISYKPDIICFSVVSNYWKVANYFARKIKDEFEIQLFAGGMHCSIFPQSYTIDSAFDGICLGEGEEALLELIERIETQQEYYNVNNFWFKREGEIVKNEIRPLIKDLDLLPFPDRAIFPKNTREFNVRFIFSRGCPFNCTYCSNKAYKDLIKGKGEIIRFRSVEKVIAEIEDVVARYKPDIFAFDDDCFNKNKKWFQEFAGKYKKVNTGGFQCNTRPELVTEPAIRLLKEAGCYQINIGIESGDEYIRNRVLNRHMSNVQIINAFRLAKKYGIQTYSFNMIGIPGETIEKFKKTVHLNQEIQPDKLQISIFYPYPGTELGTICKNEGLISKNEAHSYFHRGRLSLKKFSNLSITINMVLFKFNVYKVRSIKKAVYYLLLDSKKYLAYENIVFEKLFYVLLVLIHVLRRRKGFKR